VDAPQILCFHAGLSLRFFAFFVITDYRMLAASSADFFASSIYQIRRKISLSRFAA